MDRDHREADALRDQQLLRVPALDVVDLLLERVAVLRGLPERIGNPLLLATWLNARPLAVPALDAGALDLHADDPLLGMRQHEVDLAVARALGRVALDPGNRVECVPVV